MRSLCRTDVRLSLDVGASLVDLRQGLLHGLEQMLMLPSRNPQGPSVGRWGLSEVIFRRYVVRSKSSPFTWMRKLA